MVSIIEYPFIQKPFPMNLKKWFSALTFIIFNLLWVLHKNGSKGQLMILVIYVWYSNAKTLMKSC